jgi:hypothetical protein
MKRMLREAAYDLKEPGIHIWIIPVISFVFLLFTFYVQQSLDIAGRQNVLTIPLLEVLMPSIGGYGALMLMQGLLDTEGGELGFTYSRTNLYWGLIRQFRFFVIFGLLIALVCGAVAVIMRTEFVPIFLLILIQSFAVMAVSFLGITLGKKVSIGLIVLVTFVGIQLTLGWEFEVFNRIYLLEGSLPSAEKLSRVGFNSLVIGIFGWGIGQVWLHP